MAKEERRTCPDCAEQEWYYLTVKGNGLCEHCKGEGYEPLDIMEKFINVVSTIERDDCTVCGGDGECKTCDGSGWEEFNYDEED